MATGLTVIKNFGRKGFRLLGNGCYAAVFESDSDPNLVYKVGITTDDPYLTYIQSDIKSAHFPKVHKLFVDAENDYYIVQMERLSPIPEHKRSLVSSIRKQFEGEADTAAEYAPVIDLVNVLLNAYEDIKLDLHEGNIMMRGYTAVITDPLSHDHISEDRDLDLWMDNHGNFLRSRVSA